VETKEEVLSPTVRFLNCSRELELDERYKPQVPPPVWCPSSRSNSRARRAGRLASDCLLTPGLSRLTWARPGPNNSKAEQLARANDRRLVVGLDLFWCVEPGCLHLSRVLLHPQAQLGCWQPATSLRTPGRPCALIITRPAGRAGDIVHVSQVSG